MAKMKFAQEARAATHKDAWIEVYGDESLRAALADLQKEVGPKVMLKAIRKGLPIAKKEAKALVKPRSGALRRAIGSRSKWNKQKHLAWGMLKVMSNKKIVYNGKPHDPNKIAHLIEYGTTSRVNEKGANRGFVPQGFSFMRRALGNRRVQIQTAIEQEAFIQHENIAKRAAARAKSRGKRR